MTNPIREIKESLHQMMHSAYQKAVLTGQFLPEASLQSFVVEVPKDSGHGDYSTNIAMVMAKQLKKAPRAVAEILVENSDASHSPVSDISIAGPGFINFRLNQSYYSKVLQSIAANSDSYGRIADGAGEKVMVEFVSANPTGPMHMGNARGGALGDALASVLSWAGYEVSREFYINDTGNQIERFYQSLKARYRQIYLGDEAVPFPEDGYHGDDIKERSEQFSKEYGDQYLEADDDVLRPILVGFALPKNLSDIQRGMERYRIVFDTWFKESSLFESGDFDETIALLKSRGHTYEKDGALWYKATDFGGEKDEVLIRANGFPTYFASDIAYHRNKFYERRFDRVINVWGADHHGHVARMKGAMDAVGLDGSKLDVLLMQLVRLVRKGETVRMSKRTGKSITLEDLLDEIGVDAARFFFNLRSPDSQMEFDLDLAVEESSQNPVYYVQYAHARICSVLSHLAGEGYILSEDGSYDYDLLTTGEEIDLIKLLAAFPETIADAAKNTDPSLLTRYSIELAASFHKFYNACYIKGESAPLLYARLSLCACVRSVLRSALSILSTTAPEHM
jgi:arginyl-tRNA synthetase